MAYELIWETRGVVCRFTGVASDQDLRAANLGMTEDPRFDCLEYQLVDFVDVETLDFTSNMIRWAASHDYQASMRNSSVRVAIVGDNTLLLGLANMYRALFDIEGGTWEQGQFNTVDEARVWLGSADPSE